MSMPRLGSYEQIAAITPDIVNDEIGIVRNLAEVPREPDAPEFFHFGALACNTKAFTRYENFAIAGGAAVTREQAAAKSIGEAVERYSSAIYDFQELPLSSFEEAGMDCVPPEEFVTYAAEQYGESGFIYVPFTRSAPIRWTPALDLASRKTVHVPAAMVYMPYIYYRGTGDSPIVQPISSGLAAHLAPGPAAISAICEVVERDAFMINWQAMMAMPQIRAETLSDENFDRVTRFDRTGHQVTLFDLTMPEGIPVIMAVARCPAASAPALVFAAACDPSPEAAVRKALDELAHTRRYMQQIKRDFERLAPEPGHGNVTDQPTHLNFWVDHANAHLADFTFQSKKRIDFASIPDLSTGNPDGDVRVLVDKLSAAGYRVLISELTTPDVAEYGFTVFKAVIPGMHPLQMGYRYRSLGGRRLWEAPAKLGQRGIRRETGDNPSPHPFP
jgi:ribosomal protein S12 methylthiotransferase accessory factor